MSLLDLGAVTRTLLKIIDLSVNASPAWPPLPSPKLTTSPMPPDKLTGDPVAGLYLYHLSEDAAFKNRPPPAGVEELRYTPMALDLYYVLSAHSAETDVGTLTDGGGVGTALWGCWTNEASLAKSMTEAGERAGEPGWHLPLRAEYERLLASKVADIANYSLEAGDSGQLAATYLKSFAGAKPWLHIDIGACAYLKQASPPWPQGATGAPLRALLQFLLDRSPS